MPDMVDLPSLHEVRIWFYYMHVLYCYHDILF